MWPKATAGVCVETWGAVRPPGVGVGRGEAAETPAHTLDVADVSLLLPAPGLAPSGLLVDLALEPLDLTPQVGDDAGILSNVVGNIEQVLLHLQGAQRRGRGHRVTPDLGGGLFPSFFPTMSQAFWMTAKVTSASSPTTTAPLSMPLLDPCCCPGSITSSNSLLLRAMPPSLCLVWLPTAISCFIFLIT